MHRIIVAFSFCVLFILACNQLFKNAASGEEAKKRAYVGVKKCAMCHKAEAKGNQFGQWQKTGHAQAYKTLGTPKAKEIATKLGLTEDPQKSPKCLKCHVTGFGGPEDLVKAIVLEDGVQCESCHGPGQDYIPISIMKDKGKAIANGLEIPTEATCLKCHNEGSPSYKPFDFKERCKQVAHPRPNK